MLTKKKINGIQQFTERSVDETEDDHYEVEIMCGGASVSVFVFTTLTTV